MSFVRVCMDGGGVRTLFFHLPAGSSAVHEVSNDLLFATKLIRSWEERAH